MCGDPSHCFFWPARTDCVEDLVVLFPNERASVGIKHDSNHNSSDINPVSLQRRLKQVISRDATQKRMKKNVLGDSLFKLFRSDKALASRDNSVPFRPDTLGEGWLNSGSDACLADRDLFQCGTHLKARQGFGCAELRNIKPPCADFDQQALAFQERKSLLDRLTGNADLGRNLFLDNVGSGRKRPIDDALTKRTVCDSEKSLRIWGVNHLIILSGGFPRSVSALS